MGATLVVDDPALAPVLPGTRDLSKQFRCRVEGTKNSSSQNFILIHIKTDWPQTCIQDKLSSEVSFSLSCPFALQM